MADTGQLERAEYWARRAERTQYLGQPSQWRIVRPSIRIVLGQQDAPRRQREDTGFDTDQFPGAMVPPPSPGGKDNDALGPPPEEGRELAPPPPPVGGEPTPLPPGEAGGNIDPNVIQEIKQEVAEEVAKTVKDEVKDIKGDIQDVRENVLDLREQKIKERKEQLEENRLSQPPSVLTTNPFTNSPSPAEFGVGASDTGQRKHNGEIEMRRNAELLRRQRKARLRRQADEIGADTYAEAIDPSGKGGDYDPDAYGGKYANPGSLKTIANPMSDTNYGASIPTELTPKGEHSMLSNTVFKVASINDVTLHPVYFDTDNPAWIVFDQTDPILAVRYAAYNDALKRRGRSGITLERFCSQEFGRSIVQAAATKGLDALGRTHCAAYVPAAERAEIKQAMYGQDDLNRLAERKAQELNRNHQAGFRRALRLALEKQNRNLVDIESQPLKVALVNAFAEHLAAHGVPTTGVRALVDRAFIEGAGAHWEAALREAERLANLQETAFLELEASIMQTEPAAAENVDDGVMQQQQAQMRAARLRERMTASIQQAPVSGSLDMAQSAGLPDPPDYRRELRSMLPRPMGINLRRDSAQ